MQTSLFDTTVFSSVVLQNEAIDPIICECTECLEEITDSDDVIIIDSEKYCNDCVCYCESCSNPVLTEDLITVITNSYRQYNSLYCQDCVDSNTFYCQDCDQYFDHNNCDQHNIEDTGETICDPCRDRGDYFTCEDCYGTFSYNQYNASEYSCYCDQCYPDHIRPAGLLRDNANVLDYYQGFLGNAPMGLYLGIELEYNLKSNIIEDLANDLQCSEYGILKEDGSMPEGFEFNSIPADLKYHRENLDVILNYFHDLKVDHDRIGMHVHITKNFSRLEIAKIQQFINNPNHRTEIVSLAGRDDNNFCRYTVDNIVGYTKPQNGRYHAVNVTSKTLEFRLFKSSVCKDTIMSRLEFVLAVSLWVKQTSMLSLTWSEFQGYITDNAKTYPHLFNLI